MAEENGNGRSSQFVIMASAATILAVLGGFGYAVIQPIIDRVAKNENQNETNRTKLENDIEAIRTQYLSIREHSEFKENTKDREDKLQADLLRLINDTQAELVEFRKEIGNTYTLGDEIKKLEREITELRAGASPAKSP